GLRAPFAAQLCSIVYTRDQKKAKALSLGSYPTAPLFLIFFVDFRRLEKIMVARGHEYKFDDMMALWLGVQDVSLVVENVTLAAESLGMGSVLLGVAPIKAKKIAEMFNVPKRVFPVVGMNIGYPDLTDETVVRPRFPLHQSVFEDEYRDHTTDDIQECMREMDEGYLAQGYYIKKRIKVPLDDAEDNIGFDKYSWSEHISRKFRHSRWKDNPLLTILKENGFSFFENE
ncbi:MAG: nitroreductase family protein, partial [Candidatus Thorarchaeota archaeon]|nr:nitroreductase family protein [Candidatus Thorarchaeota archaeon]